MCPGRRDRNAPVAERIGNDDPRIVDCRISAVRVEQIALSLDRCRVGLSRRIEDSKTILHLFAMRDHVVPECPDPCRSGTQRMFTSSTRSNASMPVRKRGAKAADRNWEMSSFTPLASAVAARATGRFAGGAVGLGGSTNETSTIWESNYSQSIGCAWGPSKDSDTSQWPGV